MVYDVDKNRRYGVKLTLHKKFISELIQGIKLSEGNGDVLQQNLVGSQK